MVLMKIYPYLWISVNAFEIFSCQEAQVTSYEICDTKMASEQAFSKF